MKSIKSWALLLCATGFAVIAYFVSSGTSFAFDRAVMEVVVSLRQDLLTQFFVPFTHTGDWQFVVLICACLLMFQRTRRTFGFPMTISAIVSVSLYQMLKYIFQRPRPSVLHLIEQGGFSFPSGHSITSFVFYGTLILILYRQAFGEDSTSADIKSGESLTASRNQRLFWLAAVVLSAYIFLMGLSRVYLGVHYPTDVAASWLLGICLLHLLAPTRK